MGTVPLRRAVILVIADLSLRAAITFSLEARDIAVSGYSGLGEMPTDRQPSCIVVDLSACEHDLAICLDLVQQPNPSHPVILLSDGAPSQIHRAIEQSGCGMIHKPLLCDTLFTMIKELPPTMSCEEDHG